MRTADSPSSAVKYGLGKHIGTIRPHDLAIEEQVRSLALSPPCTQLMSRTIVVFGI